jgi:hypothetical protein
VLLLLLRLLLERIVIIIIVIIFIRRSSIFACTIFSEIRIVKSDKIRASFISVCNHLQLSDDAVLSRLALYVGLAAIEGVAD